MAKIAPSILSSNFSHLAQGIEQCGAGGADYVHVDVMDGHFVPNLTIGPPVVKDLRKTTEIPFDVHLMIENPDAFIPAFSDAGADIITVHVEACVHLQRTLQFIASHDAKAGVSLNPATPLSTIQHVLDDVDLILIMSVNPGFGGQSFIPDSLSKIRELKKMVNERQRGRNIEIEVDGGIKLHNAAEVIEAGADVLVAGSAIFGTDDPADTIRQFKEICSAS